MNLEEYLRVYLPEKCGVHSSFGEVAWLVYCAERNGNKKFSPDKFKNVRERAKLGMPYRPGRGCVKEYEKGLDVLSLIQLNHRQDAHQENNQPEIKEFHDKRRYDQVEESVIISAQAGDWWSG
jgi:hypothetical protein